MILTKLQVVHHWALQKTLVCILFTGTAMSRSSLSSTENVCILFTGTATGCSSLSSTENVCILFTGTATSRSSLSSTEKARRAERQMIQEIESGRYTPSLLHRWADNTAVKSSSGGSKSRWTQSNGGSKSRWTQLKHFKEPPPHSTRNLVQVCLLVTSFTGLVTKEGRTQAGNFQFHF